MKIRESGCIEDCKKVLAVLVCRWRDAKVISIPEYTSVDGACPCYETGPRPYGTVRLFGVRNREVWIEYEADDGTIKMETF